MMWLGLAAFALLAMVALLVVVALAAPQLASSAVRASTPIAPPAAANHESLASLVPSPRTVVGDMPSLPIGPVLQGAQPGVACVVDLSVVGVPDSSEADDRELWLSVRSALAKKPA